MRSLSMPRKRKKFALMKLLMCVRLFLKSLHMQKLQAKTGVQMGVGFVSYLAEICWVRCELLTKLCTLREDLEDVHLVQAEV